MDLVWSPTAIGWAHGRPNAENPHGPPFPQRLSFLASRLLSMIVHFVLLDFAQWEILVVGSRELDTVGGGSVFDASLPPLRRFICGSAVTFFEACCIICGLTWTTDLAALVGVGLFGSRPECWPPAFNRPWASTSLVELWSRISRVDWRSLALVVPQLPTLRVPSEPDASLARFWHLLLPMK